MSGKTIEVCRPGRSWVKAKFRVSRPWGSSYSCGRKLELEVAGEGVIPIKNISRNGFNSNSGTMEDNESVFRWRKKTSKTSSRNCSRT